MYSGQLIDALEAYSLCHLITGIVLNETLVTSSFTVA